MAHDAHLPAPLTVRAVRANAKFAAAMRVIDRDHDRLVQEIITLTEIPAPPFKEAFFDIL